MELLCTSHYHHLLLRILQFSEEGNLQFCNFALKQGSLAFFSHFLPSASINIEKQQSGNKISFHGQPEAFSSFDTICFPKLTI